MLVKRNIQPKSPALGGDRGSHSVLKLFAGLAIAARID